jgi:hypothetical protein
MTVAILGCGPAGLLAAHACARADVEFNIYSVKKKSVISGAQYIHTPIPGVNNPHQADGHIIYSKVGIRQEYAKKVYGNPNAEVSWTTFEEGLHAAWSMEKAYNFLWDEFVDEVQHVTISPAMVTEMLGINELVICTIPAHAICTNPAHRFRHTTIWIKDGPPNQGLLDENVIEYNGDANTAYYRASNLWGHQSLEFGRTVKHARRGFKPTGTDCTCHDGMLKVGRFGEWQKGVLAHSAFFKTEHALNAMH